MTSYSDFDVLKSTPEELELFEKERQCEELQSELAEKELELVALEQELALFERDYNAKIGPLFLRLDELQAETAEIQARKSPYDKTLQEKAYQAREKANQTARQLGLANERFEETNAWVAHKSDHLKRLYREAAKLMHPDLASDPIEQEKRTTLMKKLNDAFARGDQLSIERLISDWKESPESITGDDIGSKLIRVIRRIAFIRRRLLVVEDQIDSLKSTSRYSLFQQFSLAAEEGRDLFEEMSASLNMQIRELEQRLKKEPQYG